MQQAPDLQGPSLEEWVQSLVKIGSFLHAILVAWHLRIS